MLSLTSPIKTPYHPIRPAIKFAFLCGFTFAVFLTGDPLILAVALLLVVVLYLVPGYGFFLLGLRRLAPIWLFLAVVTIWHIVIRKYAEGFAVGFRLLSAVALANLVTMTTRLDDLVAIAERLAHPFRRFGVNSKGVGVALALVVRFTPVLAKNAALLLESWKSRSPRRPSWRIVVPLTAIALDDAEHVAEALRARGGIQNQNGRSRWNAT